MLNRRAFLTTSTAALAVSAAPGITREYRQLDDPFIKYDALGMADLVRSGEVSATELTEVVIRRAETLNPALNFMATPTYDRARSASISRETRFAGVPVLIKDMVDIGGIRRTDGSRLLAANIPAQSVAYTAALEASGLNIIGTTVVPEFANGLDSELYGSARNPWNLEYSCVASSSGAACAVAAGIIPLAHGTDGGGSNRLPTSACNLFGFKPSRGRMLSGETSGGHDVFKTNGPISRTVRDAAALLEVCEDLKGIHMPMGFVEGPSSRRLRIAYTRQGANGFAAPVESVTAVQDDVAALLRDLGHEVVEIDHPINGEEYAQKFRWAFLPKFAPLLQRAMDISGRGPLETGLLSHMAATMMMEGQEYTADQVEQGLEYFASVAEIYAGVFSEFDVVFSATSPVETPKYRSIRHEDDFALKGLELEHILSMTSPVNAVGDCSMNVPLGFSAATGMPVGSMFHAPAGQDALLLQLAYELEESRPWADQWAPFSAAHIPT